LMPFYFRKECPLNSGYLSILLLLPAPPRCCRSQGSAHSHKSVSGSGKVRYWLLPMYSRQ
ncbi:hypothetical protein UL69_26155, partial [Shigella sonnei]